MALTGQQKIQLDEALRDAFRKRLALARMLSHRCNRNLEDLVGTGGLKDVVFELIEAADAEGWVDELLAGALADAPNNVRLVALYDAAWPAVDTDFPAKPTLESLIEPSLKFIDVDAWLSSLQSMTARVCRVEHSTGAALGTGFLVGPRCVLTNYHVLKDFVAEAKAPPIVFRFDFRLRPDGGKRDGVTVAPALDDEWLVAWRPYSKYDLEPAGTNTPGEDELDYALVRLHDDLGTERGWIDIRATPTLQPGQPLAILQHPAALPLKLALDTKAVLGVNSNGTRVTYRTNTLGGSSGSPCFTLDWEAAALHHSGDPAAPPLPAERNAGIPLDRIHADLEQLQRADVLLA